MFFFLLLGLERVVHFVYDGVYGSAEERLNRCGGFSLCRKFEDLLNLPEGSVTGLHDAGHVLQLGYGDVFIRGSRTKPHELWCKKSSQLIEDMWRYMAFKGDKMRLDFLQFASDRGFEILTPKTPNETRFVNSILSGINTFLRNLPALVNYLGKMKCLFLL